MHVLCLYWQATRYNLSAGLVKLQHKTLKGAKRLGGTDRASSCRAKAARLGGTDCQRGCRAKAARLGGTDCACSCRAKVSQLAVGPPTVAAKEIRVDTTSNDMNGSSGGTCLGLGLKRLAIYISIVALSCFCAVYVLLCMTCCFLIIVSSHTNIENIHLTLHSNAIFDL